MARQINERGNKFLRLADRLVGVPAVLAIAALRRLNLGSARRIPTPVRTIGLLKASGIGDVVILSGVINDLRSCFPDCRIVLFCGTSNFAFGRLLDGLDEVVALPIKKPLEALKLVRRQRPDVMIDFGMWPRFEALISTLAGASWVTGVRTPGQFRHFAYDKAIPHSTAHEIINYRNLVATLGVRSTSLPALSAASDRRRPIDQPYVVMHLWPGGANAQERSWPVEKWLDLAKNIARRGYAIVLSGGPGDREKSSAIVDAWRAESIDALNIAGSRPEETIVWLRHARSAISVNTGLLHLAAAVGTPVVALNGPTSGRRWGPLGKHTRSVSSPMVPDGYLNLGWERSNRFRNCMDAIRPETVMRAWDELVAETAVFDESELEPQTA